MRRYHQCDTTDLALPSSEKLTHASLGVPVIVALIRGRVPWPCWQSILCLQTVGTVLDVCWSGGLSVRCVFNDVNLQHFTLKHADRQQLNDEHCNDEHRCGGLSSPSVKEISHDHAILSVETAAGLRGFESRSHAEIAVGGSASDQYSAVNSRSINDSCELFLYVFTQNPKKSIDVSRDSIQYVAGSSSEPHGIGISAFGTTRQTGQINLVG